MCVVFQYLVVVVYNAGIPEVSSPQLVYLLNGWVYDVPVLYQVQRLARGRFHDAHVRVAETRRDLTT